MVWTIGPLLKHKFATELKPTYSEMNFKTLFTLFAIALFGQAVQAFQTQTVSGVVIDKTTKETLPGANIVLLNHDPLIGTSTNFDGQFTLNNVPLGRHDFQVSYLGYQTRVISEILITSGREVVLTVELTAEVFEGVGVEVVATIQKDKAINDMSYVSSKAFTIEETQRYAGGLDDPARLVTAFAGVTSSGGTQTNAISIRGNAPKSVQWRLEGIEIPNPSHFAGLSVAGGGGLTLFSSQLLADSDFMTGAFPAEYGNALSGVFDINFRSGNKNRREYAFQLGINGIEASSGGPFKKGSPSTYLFNYRFSTLTLLLPLLPTEGTIQYQDLSFKMDFPTRKAGRFEFWGIGGLDMQGLDAKEDPSDWEYAFWDFSDNDINLGVGAAGLSHSLLVNSKGYLKTTVAVSGNSTDYELNQLDENFIANPELRIRNKTGRLALKSYLNQLIGDRVTSRTGFEVQHLFYDLDLRGKTDNQSPFQQLILEDGNAQLAQAYSQFKVEFTPKLSGTAGIHTQWFSSNEEFLIEPRAALNWQMNSKTGFNLGYGLHSQIEELGIYHVRSQNQLVNEDLKLAKAHHFVAGLSHNLGEHHFVKAELFAQRLFDVPVIADSSFSMLNFVQDLSFAEELVNEGEGENYGIEFTLERFLHRGYYYLVTGTLYSSRYKGGDGTWRKSRFDQRIAANVLFGKEYFLNEGRNIFGINTRASITGGERYSRVLQTESAIGEEVIFDETNPYNNQFDAQLVVDLTLSYRTNRSGYSSIWLLQIKNLLASKDRSFDYNHLTNRVDLIEEGLVLPILSWKIEF